MSFLPVVERELRTASRKRATSARADPGKRSWNRRHSRTRGSSSPTRRSTSIRLSAACSARGVAGENDEGIDAVVICPANAGFFAMGLALLQGRTHAVRTYSIEGAQAQVPELARKYGINVALGVWIEPRDEVNREDIKRFIGIADRNRRNVVRVVVGNEALLRGDVSVERMIGYLDHVRAELQIPVSTAEPWHVWLKHPELVEHVDYLAVHMLPYWEGIGIEDLLPQLVELASEVGSATDGGPDDVIAALLDRRADARAERQWELADTIRDGLSRLGITVEDGADGVRWYRS